MFTWKPASNRPSASEARSGRSAIRWMWSPFWKPRVKSPARTDGRIFWNAGPWMFPDRWVEPDAASTSFKRPAEWEWPFGC